MYVNNPAAKTIMRMKIVDDADYQFTRYLFQWKLKCDQILHKKKKKEILSIQFLLNNRKEKKNSSWSTMFVVK